MAIASNTFAKHLLVWVVRNWKVVYVAGCESGTSSRIPTLLRSWRQMNPMYDRQLCFRLRISLDISSLVMAKIWSKTWWKASRHWEQTWASKSTTSSHLSQFPENLGDESDKQGERFQKGHVNHAKKKRIKKKRSRSFRQSLLLSVFIESFLMLYYYFLY